MVKEKNKKERYDVDASLSAKIIRILCSLVIISCIAMIVINTLNLVVTTCATVRYWNNPVELKEYVISAEGVINLEDEEDEGFIASIEERIEDESIETVAIETNIRVLLIEVFIILQLYMYYNLYKFLMVKNLKEPFTLESSKLINKVITSFVILIAISIIFGGITFSDIVLLMILFLVRYLINRGIELLPKQS